MLDCAWQMLLSGALPTQHHESLSASHIEKHQISPVYLTQGTPHMQHMTSASHTMTVRTAMCIPVESWTVQHRSWQSGTCSIQQHMYPVLRSHWKGWPACRRQFCRRVAASKEAITTTTPQRTNIKRVVRSVAVPTRHSTPSVKVTNITHK
jgi:hypothetical protein